MSVQMIRQMRNCPETATPKIWRKLVFQVWLRFVYPAWIRSSWEFIAGIARRWFFLVPGVCLGLLSVASQITGDPSLRMPPALFVAMLVGGIVIAALAEFHRVRQERDRLAEQPRAALNNHLYKGHSLRDRLLNPDLPKLENGGREIVVWVFTAGALVKKHAPGYYRTWEIVVSDGEPVAAQFLSGLDALDGICRRVGLP